MDVILIISAFFCRFSTIHRFKISFKDDRANFVLTSRGTQNSSDLPNVDQKYHKNRSNFSGRVWLPTLVMFISSVFFVNKNVPCLKVATQSIRTFLQKIDSFVDFSGVSSRRLLRLFIKCWDYWSEVVELQSSKCFIFNFR